MNVNVRLLNESGGFSGSEQLILTTVTSQDLMTLIGSATGFRFARQFVESPCLWYNCPVSKNNLISDFLLSVMGEEKSFRGTVVKVGEVSNAKFLSIQKDDSLQLYVSNKETRDYVFSLQDLGINPIDYLVQ